MGKKLEDATRDELIKAIEFRRRGQPKIEDLSDEQLRDEIRRLDKTGARELGGRWAGDMRRLVALGIIPEWVWGLLDEMVERLCAITISKFHGRDDVADYQLVAIYKLIFFTFFDIEKGVIKDLADSTSSAWKTRGLRIRWLMVAFSKVVEPVTRGEEMAMFKPNVRVRLQDREIWGGQRLYQEAESLLPSGRKTTTLLQLAVKKLLEELNDDGQAGFSEKRLSADYRRTEEWLRSLSRYRMGEFFAEREDTATRRNETFPYSTWFLTKKDRRGGLRNR